MLIGVQSYSFRDRDLQGLIDGMVEVGITSCELWQGHVEPRELGGRGAREELRRWRTTVGLDHFTSIRERFERAGLTLNAYNLSFQDHFSDAEIDRGFEMAKALRSAGHHGVGHRQCHPARRAARRQARHSRGDSQPFTGRSERVLEP